MEAFTDARMIHNYETFVLECEEAQAIWDVKQGFDLRFKVIDQSSFTWRAYPKKASDMSIERSQYAI